MSGDSALISLVVLLYVGALIGWMNQHFLSVRNRIQFERAKTRADALEAELEKARQFYGELLAEMQKKAN